MTDIKIVSIDIDGTLLNDKHEITPAVKDAIHAAEAKGVKVVITTGRPLSGVRDILNELGMNSDDQYVITHNGGLMMSASGHKTLFRAELSFEQFEAINAFMEAEKTYVQVESADQAYTLDHKVGYWASYENVLVDLPLTVFDDMSELKNIDFIKGIAMANEEELDRVQAAVPAAIKESTAVVRSTAHNLEFMNKDASKGNALWALADILGVDRQATMAIGDQENDHSMIGQAGIGVAMGNAIDSIKELANVQTTDNNHDGVAEAIKKYVL
ncbi:Cof-type HAD-IIB family hydrolase [Eupransor demetentiae]|uniref:Hydroxymethylpyrimidine pyrophosphatase and other HAD family phosphatases (Cof) n=1 Tax=Eupransor demetentiae TaxID=3109584 RepID=A0ABP0EU05_9LACO|nr:Hydroxymethylpyrimidine pyrophosphatase and other HAD family phosphatases (Cof) [Lactobacillaceae bacterium LMG 33000]